jgi:uncharacterized protein (DUF58 family)
MVKEFEQDPQADIWLFLDAQKSVQATQESPSAIDHSGDGFLLRRPKVELPCDTFEYAVASAASLARFFIGERQAVGLASAPGQIVVHPAERGERQLGKILETLSTLQAGGSISLLGLVSMQAKLLPLGSGVILITPDAQLELLVVVDDLQHRNLRPVIVLIKKETFGGTSGSDPLEAALLKRNVPLCQVCYGDDLAIQLSLPAVYFQRAHRSTYHVDRQA